MNSSMRRAAWLLLGSLSLLTACPNRKTAPADPNEPPPDYEGTRESSKRSHQKLDGEKAPGER